MAVNLRASVRSVINELKKNIAQEASELAGEIPEGLRNVGLNSSVV